MNSDTILRPSLKVLHVEDNLDDAELTRCTLGEEWPDCQVTRVETREDLLAALNHLRFDLILSDFSLPSFDGLSALELSRQLQPQVPYIFFSGTIGEENAVNALQRGASDYIIKDRPVRLIPAIRQALERVENAASRTRAQEALRENQDRYRQITENVADLIAVVDLDGRRVYNNPAYRSILGDPEKLRGTDLFETIHPEDRSRVRSIFYETVRTGAGWRTEYRILTPDGEVRYIESRGGVLRRADGSVANILLVSRDVTEGRAAELRLRRQASLLDKASDAIIVTGPGRLITYWNASAERIYGWSAIEVLGRDLREIGLGFDSSRFALASAQVSSRSEWRGHFSLRTKAGAMIQIESTWSLVLGSDGESDSIMLIDTDVTEKRKLENRLLRADRMDSIGMLAGGVAHDLNNALTPIVMGAELLRRNPTDPKNVRIVENIDRCVHHGAALVRQLLTFARGGEGELTEVLVEELIEDAKGLVSQGLPRTISLKADCVQPLWLIRADATQIKQVLVNLCINARDALPAGGRIVIHAENAVVSEAVAALHSGAQAGSHVRISVKDNGTGILPDILERIFDPFFTTKGLGKGTGLGLSTVVGIIRKHGGFLTVESQVGHGTEFQIFIPGQLQPQKVEALPGDPFAKAKSGENVLLIDDDPLVRDLFQHVLERAGYHVAAAADGRSGLAEFEKGAAPAIAIVDMKMPGMGGPEVIAALRAKRPELPIVAVSGYFEPKLVASLNALDSSIACLNKPIVAELLLSTLRRVARPAS
jgi:PAS domain S-box-containing protein